MAPRLCTERSMDKSRFFRARFILETNSIFCASTFSRDAGYPVTGMGDDDDDDEEEEFSDVVDVTVVESLAKGSAGTVMGTVMDAQGRCANDQVFGVMTVISC